MVKNIYLFQASDISLKYSNNKVIKINMFNFMEIYMKQFFIKALIIWHDIRVAYRNRSIQHRLGS